MNESLGTRDDDAYFRWPRISERAINEVASMLRAGVTSYDRVRFEAFEADVARLFGVRHALCCNNGTAAAFSAFRALGIGPGDSIIAPAITHWASALPAIQCGARISFADVLPDSCHADPRSVRHLIRPDTKAVVVTHMFGEPLELDQLRALCDEHDLALVEDVSHAHGATFQGRPVGGFGDVSFCSFQAAKLVSAGEGGALLTNREDVYYRALELGHPRRIADAPPEWRALAGVGRGFKFLPATLSVAIAHDSLRNLEEQNAERTKACRQLRATLAAAPELTGLDRSPAGRVYFRCELFLALSAAGIRDRLIETLVRRGVRAHRLVGYLPDHPSFAEHVNPGEWPVAQDIMRRAFFLEAFTAYSLPLVERYASTFLQTLRDVKRGTNE